MSSFQQLLDMSPCFEFLYQMKMNDDYVVRFLHNFDILQGIECPRCTQRCRPARPGRRTHVVDCFCWECPNCHRQCAITNNSYLYGHHLSLFTHLLLLYLFFWLGSAKLAAEFSELDESFIGKHFRFFRRCISRYMRHYYYQDFRFPARYAIQWDETALGHRKHGRGRRVTSHWILGGIQHETGLVALYHVRVRNAATMVPIILRHSHVVQRIITDHWRAYLAVQRYGRFHWNVNHTRTFVDPITGVHTQDIEGLWARVKRSFHSHIGIAPGLLQQYLDEWVFKNNLKREGSNVWHCMLLCIGSMQNYVRHPF